MGQLVDNIMKNVNKKAKEEIFTKGLSSYRYERIPFTSPRMNYCTFGGLPVGKLIEFYGEEHGGKTTSALDIVANYQQMPEARDVLYVDAENTLDVEWAKKIGVNTDNLYLMQPKEQSAEEIFQHVCDIVDTGEIGLWVIDSLGVLVSQQALDKTLEEKTYAGISKALTDFSKRIIGIMSRHRCTGIGINQMRDVLNSTFPQQTTPGGRGWKHCCAVRMQFSRGKFVDADGKELSRGAENPAGNKVLMSMTKNKTCPPTQRVGYYTLNYEEGIDYLADLIEVAIMHNIVYQHGSWFDIVDVNTGEVLESKIQGQSNVYNKLMEDDKLLNKVDTLVNSCIIRD